LVTLCETLLRLTAGGVWLQVAKVVIPEVLIGEVNFGLSTWITPACADAQVFFCRSSICNSNRQFTHLVAFPFIPLRFLAGEESLWRPQSRSQRYWLVRLFGTLFVPSLLHQPARMRRFFFAP